MQPQSCASWLTKRRTWECASAWRWSTGEEAFGCSNDDQLRAASQPLAVLWSNHLHAKCRVLPSPLTLPCAGWPGAARTSTCRYETNLLNTAAQALDFLEDAGHHPNIFVHLDTYHMNASGGTHAGCCLGVPQACAHACIASQANHGPAPLLPQIEEASMEQAVRLCGERLGYVHIGESHRWAAWRG